LSDTTSDNEGLSAMSWITSSSDDKSIRTYSRLTYIFFYLSVTFFIAAMIAVVVFYISDNQVAPMIAGASLVSCSVFGLLWIEFGKNDASTKI
jgi:uncharacterized membrane protein